MTTIPFQNLLVPQRYRVWAVADSLETGNLLPLVEMTGGRYNYRVIESWYQTHVVPVGGPCTFISEYWNVFQSVPSIKTFILEGTI